MLIWAGLRINQPESGIFAFKMQVITVSVMAGVMLGKHFMPGTVGSRSWTA